MAYVGLRNIELTKTKNLEFRQMTKQEVFSVSTNILILFIFKPASSIYYF